MIAEVHEQAIFCPNEKATVELLGGKLEIELQEGHIFMTGPATTVFEGKIKI